MSEFKTCIFWVAIALMCAGTAHAQLPGRIEIHAVKSRTLTGAEFLRGGVSGQEALLGGELRFPLGAPAKVPAVVLVHGSGGISGGVDAWARTLNDAGFAVFILDAFSGRGIVSTVENQNQLHNLAMLVDAYRALDVLAAHPRIRSDRIAVMGFSKGAVASVFSAADRFRNAYGGSNRFAAHVGLYTPCNTRFDADTKVSAAPIRLFHGITDDYVSIAPCRDFAAELKAAGADVVLTEYPDSQHGFDNPTSPQLLALPKAQSTRNCRLKESANGVILNTASGAAFSMADSCVAVGAHIGYNPDSTAAVRLAVMGFLKQALLN
jgi:dienelactone hydrolase